MSELDDHDLLAQYAQKNSDAAFAALAERHIGLVYSVALRSIGNVHAAEEVSQAVFIILAKKADKLSRKIALPGWLYQTTRLTAANFLRGEIRRQKREQEAFMQSLSNDTETWRHIAPLLDDALDKLSGGDRDAIVLRFFENKNLREVGLAMGASEDAVKMRVNRALEKLRKVFSKRGVAFSATAIAGAVLANSVHAAPVGLAKTVSVVAIAKGAAAGSSTLILAKGTLKLMAWTKIKIAAITGAVILLATATTVTTIYHHRHSPPYQTGRMRLPTGNVTPMIGCGYGYVVILASDGSLWSWGEKGLGWPVFGYTNVEKSVSLRRIGNEADWKNVAVGDSQCLAIKSDGTLWGWGENLYGELGDGTKITRPTPVPSVPGDDWRQAAISGPSGYALKNNGTLWAWGNNWAGQMGIGNTKSTTNAVQIGTSTNWAKIWVGGVQIVGLQSDGSLWFWGLLTGGDKKKEITVPTRVSPDTNWTEVCFGYFTVLALKSDGTLWTWGLTADFYNGRPDNNLDDPSRQLTPVQVGTENDWQSISSTPECFYHLLQKKDGSLWALDASGHAQSKPGMQYKPWVPQKIDFHKDIAAYVAYGSNVGILLTPDGEVWTWGSVLGEFSAKDFGSKNGDWISPKHRVIDYPWQVFNIP